MKIDKVAASIVALLLIMASLIPSISLSTPTKAEEQSLQVLTYEATNVMPNSVTFNGGLIGREPAHPYIIVVLPYLPYFQYGFSSGAYTSEVLAQFTDPENFSADVTVYGVVIYYRAKLVLRNDFGGGRPATITLYGPEKMVVLPTGLLKPGQPTAGAGGGQGGPVGLPTSTIKSATLSAAKVTPGTPVTVNATVENSGTVNGSSMIKLYVNGQEEASRGVTVSSGSSTPVSFTVSRNEPGTYSVYVGGTPAGSFTVDTFADGNMILYVTGGLMLIVLIGGMVYFTRRRV